MKIENKNYGFLKYINETVVSAPDFKFEGNDNGIVIISTKATSGIPMAALRDVAWHTAQGLKGQSAFMYNYDFGEEDSEDVDTYKTAKIFKQLDFGKTASGSDITKINIMNFKSNKIILGFKKHDKKWVEEAAAELINAAIKNINAEKAKKQKQKDYEETPEYRASVNKYNRERAVERKEKLAKIASPEITKRVSARKYQGDDKYSWAVFIDGRPFVTGLGQDQVDYYKRVAYKKLQENK